MQIYIFKMKNSDVIMVGQYDVHSQRFYIENDISVRVYYNESDVHWFKLIYDELITRVYPEFEELLKSN